MIPSKPSRTAWRVALRRASHQLIDQPRVLDDPLALRILGPETEAELRANPEGFDRGMFSAALRAFMAVRARVVDDQLAQLRAQGIRQYVVLGAGLDTSAYRDGQPALPLRVFEVDHPATQAWKCEQLQRAGIAIPLAVSFVPVDFEGDTLADALAAAGFDAHAGAMFSWLGVTPYLTSQAALDTLAYVARATEAGGGVVFDYALDPRLLTMAQRAVYRLFAARVAAAGEPWRLTYDPRDLIERLHALGFRVTEDLSGEALNERYFANRTDGLRVGSLAHVMWAGASPLTRGQ